MPSVEECTSLAHQHEKDGDIVTAVQYYVISESQSEALRLGMSYVKVFSHFLERISSKEWTLDSLWRPVRWMQCLHPRILSQEKNQELYKELRFFSAYVGALKALRDGYWPVVTPLLIQARDILEKNRMLENLLENEVLLDGAETVTFTDSDTKKNILQNRVFGRLIEKLGDNVSENGNFGEVFVAGSHLPRHSDQRRSIFGGKPIQGPVYYLDESETAISLSEAIMWARVNLLSPLRAYARIVPF
ncbi:hypothetical protein HPB50_011445 [Hyalomma asiaticum]|uniref:Uncharacterized protein n=1 Tax=Hyalomma asiaticum TaxID=266040 RepID=A0ACB7SM18_HYAAI|nr:hypothetical protein HPB50_011445 [Hyalomma asiaticum]